MTTEKQNDKINYQYSKIKYHVLRLKKLGVSAEDIKYFILGTYENGEEK